LAAELIAIVETNGTAMKIGVYGNCQTASFAACLQARLPNDQVIACTALEAPERLAGCELIMIQNDYWNNPAYLAELRKNSKIKFVTIPTFYFPGYHPDLVIEHHPDGSVLIGPAGSYNSSIVIYAAMRGLSVAATVGLFNDRIFDHLGFYGYWGDAKKHIEANISSCGLDGPNIFASWLKTGCFAYSVNHMTAAAAQIVADAIISQIGLDAAPLATLSYDPLKSHGKWPVYPEIASRLGVEGGYDFQFGPPLLATGERSSFDLEYFVQQSFCMYQALPPGGVISNRVQYDTSYRELEFIVRPKKGRMGNVYVNLPASSYWKKAISQLDLSEIDPVTEPRFKLQHSDKVATAGSCFAQHIARTLVAKGFKYYVAEQVPSGNSTQWAEARGYGLFSARYGNIYTARQLRQLIERSVGSFVPSDFAWKRPDGRYVDPFRPQLEPDGFLDPQSVQASAVDHLSHVRKMISSTDVFVFTLGLTECWVSKKDGAVFPIAPGVIAGRMDDELYEFKNFRVSDVVEDLKVSIELMRRINPNLRIILTVSPVPLVATYEKRHVLSSTICSKSILRAAADEIYSKYEFVEYFPSYEIIVGPHNLGSYFEADKRSVTEAGVNRVMELFEQHYFGDSHDVHSSQMLSRDARAQRLSEEMQTNSKILCDEELLDASQTRC
jgi:hypothetical protein